MYTVKRIFLIASILKKLCLQLWWNLTHHLNYVRIFPGKIQTCCSRNVPTLSDKTLQLCQILINFNNVSTPEAGNKFDKSSQTDIYLHIIWTACVATDISDLSLLIAFLWIIPRMSGGVVCQPVSILKADILNIAYDCYSRNDNVVMAACTCRYDYWHWFFRFLLWTQMSDKW